MAHILLVLMAFGIDEIITVCFPNSFLVNELLFIPNLGFCAMILTLRKFDFLDSCLFAFVFGMFYDFLFANTFLTYAIIFTIVGILLQLWSKHMTDSLIESLILCIVTIFVKDMMIYLLMSFQKTTNITLINWMEKYELLTLLTNAILSMFIYFLLRIKDDYLKMKALRIRKGERVEWFRLKSRD